MNTDAAFKVPAELNAAVSRYRELLRIQNRLLIMTMVAFVVIYLPIGLVLWGVLLTLFASGDLGPTIAFAALMLGYLALFFVVVPALFRPSQTEAGLIEQDFLAQGFRIRRVRCTKIEVEILEGN